MAIVQVSDDLQLEYAWRHRGGAANVDEPPANQDRPPVLLIQGMSGHMFMWGEPFLSRLAAGHDLLLFNNRGVKESSRVEEPFTIPDLAADTVGLLDALGVAQAHVVGISMGGMVAQELALRWPERVVTLTIGGSFCGGPGAQVLTSESTAKLFQHGGGPEAAIRNNWELNLGEAYRSADVDGSRFAAFREAVLRRPVASVVIQMQAVAFATHETHSRLPGLAVPTLVVHGTDDQVLPHVNGPIIAAAIPHARLETMQDVGHLWWWEQPARSARMVLEHLGG